MRWVVLLWPAARANVGCRTTEKAARGRRQATGYSRERYGQKIRSLVKCVACDEEEGKREKREEFHMKKKKK